MMQRLTNSWELVKQSWAVLKADKELAIFPIIAAFASLLVMATFLLPMVFAGMFDSMISEDGVGVLSYIMLFLFYVVTYTVSFYCNSALVGAALIRIRGGDPTVSDGIKIANAHFKQIFGYALIAATVGLVLKALSERSGAIGRIVIGLVGMAWSLATFLVVPVLVSEDIGPIDAVKRSGSLLKKTWGEQVAGNFGIGTVFGLATFLVILVCIPLIFVAISTESVALIIGVIVLAAVGIIGLSLLSATLSGIYAAAVYEFATTGKSGEFFDASTIKSSFKMKK